MKPRPKAAIVCLSNSGAPLVTAVVLCLGSSLSQAVDNNWTGTTSSDWNDGTNWSVGGVPDRAFGDNAVVSTVSPNIATITEDISFTPNDIIVKGGGRIDHRAGIAGTNGGAWMFVGQDATPSFYNLADTGSAGDGITGFAQGAGSLNATGNLLVGAFGDGRKGTLSVNTSETLTVSNELFIGDSLNSVGEFSLESGTVTVNNNTFIGNNRGNGTLTMSGGTIIKTGGGQFRVGNDNGAGTVVHSGGTISSSNELYVGNEKVATGIYTLSGTGELNIGNEVVVGRESGTGILNVNGGTLTTTGNGNMHIGRRNSVGTLDQTAGTISVNREFGVGTRDDNKIGIGTYNLRGGSLSATNNIFIGKEQGSSGNMTMTGGSMTGGDKLIIGDNGATGVLSQSDGTVEVQNEVYVGNGLSQAPVASILANANDGQLEKRSEWPPGTVTVQDNGNWNVSIGEWYGSGLTTAVIPFRLPNFGAVADPFTSASFGVNLYNIGGATVTDLDLYAVRVSASPQIATTDWYNGSAPDPSATLIQESFLTPTSTTTSVGPESGPNNLTDAAGNAALLAYLNSAYNGGAGAGQFVFLRVSYGSDSYAAGNDAYNFTTRNAALDGDAPVINFTSTTPAIAPDGTYTLSGTGVINVGNEIIVGRESGSGTLNLNGGTVNANKISGGTGAATVNFNGGVLRAKRDESNFIENLDVANLQGGGLRIDSNGFNVGTGQILTGTGGLEKTGAGQLTLSGANAYAGTTTVAAGVLRIEKAGLNAIVDASANTLVAEFNAQPAPGDYPILTGPLAGAQTFRATGLGSNQSAAFSNATSIVTVTGEPDSDPYMAWIESFTPNALLPDEASKLPGADPESDGISNLMEFVLGGSPVVDSQASLPKLATVGTDLVLSFQRSDESESVTTQTGQWSTDLINWNDVTPVLVNENAASADDMSIVVSKSNAMNGKLFLRLKVAMP
ncbi:MAG: beta strand repeat-containing protein [Luteolibacter sp.]